VIPEERVCPKCRAEMEPGFVLEQTYGAMTWVEGTPERSIWTGIKLKGRERIPVTTFRCTSCGYLESYATSA
jgi:predicted nucleic-acid-binding Zn-ribbon protein